MKKIMMAIIFCSGFMYPAVFAGDDSVNAHIANSLSLIFKMTDSKTLVSANDYYETTLRYKGIVLTAFKSNTGWVGFFKQLSAQDLPNNALSTLHNKYNNYNIKDVTMYLNNEGDVTYFARVSTNKKCVVLQIDPSGSVHVFNCKQQIHSR